MEDSSKPVMLMSWFACHCRHEDWKRISALQRALLWSLVISRPITAYARIWPGRYPCVNKASRMKENPKLALPVAPTDSWPPKTARSEHSPLLRGGVAGHRCSCDHVRHSIKWHRVLPEVLSSKSTKHSFNKAREELGISQANDTLIRHLTRQVRVHRPMVGDWA
jgi:hypothetical protein